MSDNSLLLLAVKRSTMLGFSSLKGGNNFQNFYGISAVEVAEVENNNMGDYIDILIDECMAKIPKRMNTFRKDVVEELQTSKEFESYKEDDDYNLFCDTFYEDNIGKLYLFMYLFRPINNDDTRCETMTIDLKFRLADIAVTITCMKKRFLGRTKRWTELRYIKAGVKFADYVTALSLVMAPLFQTSIKTPNGIQAELKAQAASVPDTMPSDDARRTVYNPMQKMNVVVTDPDVLKLIPGKWERVTSEMVQQQVEENLLNYWKFDE